MGAGRTLFSELGVRLQLDRTRILESPYAPHLFHSELTGFALSLALLAHETGRAEIDESGGRRLWT